MTYAKALDPVLENTSSVEYRLLHWRNRVTQLYEDQRLSTIPETADPYRRRTRDRLDQNDGLEAAISGGDANVGHLRQTSVIAESPATPLSVQSTDEPCNRDLSIPVLTQSSSSPKSSEPASTMVTASEVGLRGPKFIQTLSR
jgi:hypothetical protein